MFSAARAAVLLGLSCICTQPGPAQSYNFAELDRTVDSFARTQPNGVALVLIQNGRIVYERRTAGPAARESIHTASAIKVVTAALLSMLQEDGALALDAPLGGTLYRALSLAALLLFLMTFVVNTGAELIRQRLRRKFAQL